MRTVTIKRIESDDSGTFGLLSTDSVFSCYTAELPWRENHSETSCIPEGEYRCVWGLSSKHGPVFVVLDVPERSHILIHAGNWAGDVSKGLRSSVKGCILLGRAIDQIAGQKALLSSRDAVSAFEDDMERSPFDLIITRSA